MVNIYAKYVGRVFDNRYRIEQVIGIGGMAVVFKATDLLMRRVVAVKILKDEISSDEQSVKRFSNESKAIAMLSHPNIVNIYDVSVRANIKYIVMEFVEGITLKSYIERREVLNFREMISYTTQILRALDHAHKKGIVHRDIKPQNIMLLKNGVIKVMDFGIAKLPNAETITMTDKAIGTVYYISPEQVEGGQIDARSDIYALGAMMYEMATGQLPFTAETPVSVALMQVNEEATPPRQINPQIPVGLEQIIVRAMEKNPETRYQSAAEMLSHILRLKENPKIMFKENKVIKKREEKGQKQKHAVSHSMFPIIMGVTTAFLIVAAISAYYIVDTLFLNGASKKYETIEVENFVGATYTEELADWFENSEYYSLLNLEYAFDDTVEEGKIISQEPEASEKKKVLAGKQRCEMGLTVSKGRETVILADYTVRDYREVKAELQRLDLVAKVVNVYSDVYEIGYVIKTVPEAGTELNLKDVVEIHVSQGSNPVMATAPNFVGLTEAEALASVIGNQFAVGEVTYVKSQQPVGTVLKQSVEAWSEIPLYAEIDFEVSGGKYYTGDGDELPHAGETAPPVAETEPPFASDPWWDAEETENGESDEPADEETRGSDEETKRPNSSSSAPGGHIIIIPGGNRGSGSSGNSDIITDDDFFG